VFERHGANRFELDVAVLNPRATHVYRREGFVQEGTVREVYRHRDGAYHSSHLFAMLRRGVARPAATPGAGLTRPPGPSAPRPA
jgi:RimJ/RimL family protein N-acetyltransferase